MPHIVTKVPAPEIRHVGISGAHEAYHAATIASGTNRPVSTSSPGNHDGGRNGEELT